MKQINKEAINNLEQYSGNIYVFRRTEEAINQIGVEEYALERAAKSSLKVAKLCLEIEEIPNSIFNFQQAVEKIAKTLLYSSSLYDTPRKGQHEPHLLFEDLFLKDYVEERDELGYEMCNRCKCISENNPCFSERIVAFNDIFNSIQEKYEEFLGNNISFANTYYYQYATMVLCYLFINTEQNARYPKYENGKLVTPSTLYPLRLKKPLSIIAGIIERVIML